MLLARADSDNYLVALRLMYLVYAPALESLQLRGYRAYRYSIKSHIYSSSRPFQLCECRHQPLRADAFKVHDNYRIAAEGLCAYHASLAELAVYYLLAGLEVKFACCRLLLLIQACNILDLRTDGNAHPLQLLRGAVHCRSVYGQVFMWDLL